MATIDPEIFVASDLLLSRAPTKELHAATKAYVDTAAAGKADSSHTHTASDVTDLGTAATCNTGTSSGNVPVIGSDGKLATSIFPDLVVTDTYTVASEAAMLALTAQKGDVAVRSDTSETYILAADDATALASWVKISAPTDISALTTHTGNTAIHVPTTGTTGHVLTKTADGAEFAAIPATAWDDITGKPDTFTPATHNHDSDYLKSANLQSTVSDSANPVSAAGVKTYVDALRYSTDITGDGTTTDFTVTHSLACDTAEVAVYRTVDGAKQRIAVAVAGSANSAVIKFAVAPANGTVYTVVVRK